MGKQVKNITPSKEAFKSKYGADKVYQWSGYLDEPREANVVALIEKIAAKQNLIPSYFATIAIGEGLGLYIDNNYHFVNKKKTKTGKIIKIEKVKTNVKIDGFEYLGTDDFGSDFIRYKKYLPKDYNKGKTTADFKNKLQAEFITVSRINELNKETTSALFKNLESALWAFGATLKHRLERCKLKGKNLGYSNPTEDQLAYWTYVFFQGEGNATRWLTNNKSFKYKSNASARGEVNRLALNRLATWRFLQSYNLFTK